MALIDQYALSRDSDFQKKILISIVRAALKVVGEPPTPNPTGTDKRHELGVAILENPEAGIGRFALVIATDPSITVDSTDANIDAAVDGSWDKVAGVRAGEKIAPAQVFI